MEDCLCDNRLPWELGTTACEKTTIPNPSNETKLYLAFEDQIGNLATFCNCSNTEVCATDIDLAFDTLNEELDTTCGKLIFNAENGGTFDFALIEPPCIDATTQVANATKKMVEAWKSQQNVYYVIAQQSGYRVAGKGKISARGNFTPDLSSVLPTPFPWTISYVKGSSTELACNEVFPYIVAIRPTVLQGAGAPTFAPSEIKILSGNDDLMAAAAAAQLDPEAQNVGLFVNTNEGSASNLVDNDTSSQWDGGVIGGNPYAGAMLCYEVPTITGIEMCAGSTAGDQDDMPTDFFISVSGDGGVTWTDLQEFTGNTWVAGECKQFTVADPRSGSTSISGLPGVQWVYSAIETTSGTALTETSQTTGVFNRAKVTNLSGDLVYISFGDNPACSGALRFALPTGSGEHELPVPDGTTKFNLCSDGISSDVNVFLYKQN